MEFKLPEGLDGYTEESIHDKMLKNAPEGVDLSEGNMFWDHTRPTAVVLAEYSEFYLPLALMMRFPQYASGIYLDYHGDMVGIERRDAQGSKGVVVVRAKEDITLRRGAVFTSLGDTQTEALYYESTHTTDLPADQEVEVAVKSVGVGSIQNLPANSVDQVDDRYEGVEVVGSSEMTGAIDDEGDDAYKKRIINYYRSRPLSGAKRDYERWALEVPGVGSAVVQPLWAGNGTVRVLIADEDNQIASDELVDAVQQYIDPTPSGTGGGKAPIGASVTVGTMRERPIDITFNKLTIRPGYTKHEVERNIKRTLNEYFAESSSVNYNKCVALSITADGVNDFADLLLDGERDNIELADDERASVGVIKHES